jgi:peptidoglycan hydrolase-like protein with peptidoglycan-binding domain
MSSNASQGSMSRGAMSNGSHSISHSQVKKLQRALKGHGYNLEADGQVGPKTRSALKKYQRNNGLKVTGKPDQETLRRLGMGFGRGTGHHSVNNHDGY